MRKSCYIALAVSFVFSQNCASQTPSSSRPPSSETTRAIEQQSNRSSQPAGSLNSNNASSRTATLEQSTFGVGTPVERPAETPSDVLRILTLEVNREYDFKNEPSVGVPTASWFVASNINLDGDQFPDLIVQATNPVLFGANVIPFWLFRDTGRGRTLVLSVSGFSLHVLNSKTNGVRNVLTEMENKGKSLSALYKYNGEKYQLSRK